MQAFNLIDYFDIFDGVEDTLGTIGEKFYPDTTYALNDSLGS